MKIKNLIYCFSGVLSLALDVHAQGTFQNLNFQSASFGPPLTGPITGASYQPINLALPGWSASIGGVAVTELLENGLTAGTPDLDIFSPSPPPVAIPYVMNGEYTLWMQANFGQNVSVWQNGMIPDNAQSLEFNSYGEVTPVNPALVVTFAGNNLSPIPLYFSQSTSGQSYEVYGVNIAPYAGQTGQLEFTDLASALNNIALNGITFSTDAVPEPNTVELVLIAATMLGLQRWRKRRKAIPS